MPDHPAPILPPVKVTVTFNPKDASVSVAGPTDTNALVYIIGRALVAVTESVERERREAAGKSVQTASMNGLRRL